MVLASCEQAGATSSDDGALAALGPQLAKAGVPAVLAMQGNISMDTVAQFMPPFFKSLRDTGQVDRAMTEAREKILGAATHGPPRSISGSALGGSGTCPGSSPEPERGTRDGPCCSGTLPRASALRFSAPACELLVGSARDLARKWADSFRFPMSPWLIEDLPQVAQFLLLQQQSKDFIGEIYEEHLQDLVIKRYETALPAQLRQAKVAQLDDILEAVGKTLRGNDPAEPHRVLAPFLSPCTSQPTRTRSWSSAPRGRQEP